MLLLGYGKACRFCKKLSKNLYCSDLCRWRFNYKKYYARHILKKGWMQKRCKGCGTAFHVERCGRGKQHRAYCTERCARNAAQRRHYAKKKREKTCRPG
jgi:hypothetical protein